MFHSSLDGEVYNEATKWGESGCAIALSGAIPVTRFEGDCPRLLRPEKAFVRSCGKGRFTCDKCSFLSDLGIGSFVLTTVVFQAKLRSIPASYPAPPESMFLVDHVEAGPNALPPE